MNIKESQVYLLNEVCTNIFTPAIKDDTKPWHESKVLLFLWQCMFLNLSFTRFWYSIDSLDILSTILPGNFLCLRRQNVIFSKSVDDQQK